MDPMIPGLNWAGLVAAATIIVLVVNTAKDLLKITGKPILYLSGALSLIWAIAKYQPDIILVFIATGCCWLVATGAWSGAKKLFHKVGTPSAKR